MPIRRRHINMAGGDFHTVLGENNPEFTVKREELRQHASMVTDMHDDEDRRRAPCRQRADDPPERIEAAGGRCDYDN